MFLFYINYCIIGRMGFAHIFLTFTRLVATAGMAEKMSSLGLRR